MENKIFDRGGNVIDEARLKKHIRVANRVIKSNFTGAFLKRNGQNILENCTNRIIASLKEYHPSSGQSEDSVVFETIQKFIDRLTVKEKPDVSFAELINQIPKRFDADGNRLSIFNADYDYGMSEQGFKEFKKKAS